MKLLRSDRLLGFAPQLLVLFSAVLAAAACLQALHYPFVFDDLMYIVANPRLSGLHFGDLWKLLIEPYNEAQEFLPLRELSYWIDISLFGSDPAGFRSHNILLYLLCLPLVYSITVTLWTRFRSEDAGDARWIAASVTCLFALSPAHVEAVVWIAGRKDVLSGLFSLLAIWLALKAGRVPGLLSASYATATLLALLAAIYSKATAVSVAVLVALLWLAFWYEPGARERSRRSLLWPLLSLLLAVGATLSFAAITTQRIPFYFGIEMATRALAVLGWMARLSFSPEDRHFYYPIFEYPWLPAMVILGVVALGAAVWGGMAFLRRRSLAGFALLAFLLLCIPSLQLVPYRPPSPVSDRFLFLAIWPAMLWLVTVSWRLAIPARVLWLLAIPLSWSVQEVGRPQDWESFERVVEMDWQTYPRSPVPAALTIILGKVPQGLYGEAAERANLIPSPEVRNAMAKFVRVEQAIHSANPRSAIPELMEWGQILKRPPPERAWDTSTAFVWDKLIEALVDDWRVLSKKYPDDAGIHYGAGMYLLGLPLHKEAAAHLQAAASSPQLPAAMRGSVFKSLGIALLDGHQLKAAEDALHMALEQSPPDQEAHCVLAVVYAKDGKTEDMAREEAACPDRTFRAESPQ